MESQESISCVYCAEVKSEAQAQAQATCTAAGEDHNSVSAKPDVVNGFYDRYSL